MLVQCLCVDIQAAEECACIYIHGHDSERGREQSEAEMGTRSDGDVAKMERKEVVRHRQDVHTRGRGQSRTGWRARHALG